MSTRGFTLTELAVVLAVTGLLLTSTLYTFSAQIDGRSRAETQRRLEEARELVLGFALVNGRLPCPGTASGDEAGGGAAPCASHYGGFLPARSLGFQPTDAAGFGLDAWGNRIRYAVSAAQWGAHPFARYTKQHAANDPAAAWSITQSPPDLVVCSTAPAAPGAAACDAGASVTNQNTVVAIVLSTGKNGSPAGPNEARNLDGNALFVSGELDDQLLWIPVGLLYGRLISAGVLP